MNRWEFLSAAVLSALAAHQVPADDTFDPASEARTQSLRVLLGNGSAQRVDANTFIFEGRRYRGTFSIASGGGVVNMVALEDYLYSVVPREMPYSWPAQALQTQAIVARTYVLQRSNPRREYDLVPSEADQVYTGIDAEHPQASQAVDATAGQVLRFQDGFAQALYSSCCGGHTESNGAAWGGRPLPYLGGVPCTYCKPSPWYAWTQRVSLDQLLAALAPQLQGIAEVNGIALDAPDSSGRAQFWSFSGASGTQRVKAQAIRSAIGTRTLPSLLVHSLALSQAQREVTIEGGGLGHGVGLCQWGARGMALDGAGAREILAYYYPGTGIGND